VPEGIAPLTTGDAWAVVLAAMSFLLVFAVPALRRDPKATLIVWASTLAHQVAAVINALAGTVKGADADALAFHQHAIVWSTRDDFRLSFDADFYAQLLGTVYRVLGSSIWLGGELSILAFVLSCGALLEVIHHLGIERDRLPILAAFALLPTMVLMTSVTLREAYQVLFFILTTLYALRLIARPSVRPLIGVVLNTIALSFWHKGLLLMLPVIPMLAILWPAAAPTAGQPRPRGRLARRLGVLAIGAVVAFGLFRVTGAIGRSGSSGSEVVQILGKSRAIEFASQYRKTGIGIRARADYGVTLDITSAGGLARSIPLVYVYYLFAPFPWQARTAVDVYAGFEALLRFALFLGGVYAIVRAPPVRRRSLLFCAALFFIVSFLWALGTVNYGTAIRHHLMTNWMLLVIGGPPLLAVGRSIARYTPRLAVPSPAGSPGAAG